jgi:hypothetical protein
MPNETRGQIHSANSSIEEIQRIVKLSLPNQEANLGIGTLLILVLVGFHSCTALASQILREALRISMLS